MEVPSWQEHPSATDTTAVSAVRTEYTDTRKLFAVDSSGSTAGRILESESDTVLGLHTNLNDQVCKWNTRCEAPKLIDGVDSRYFYSSGGTYPSEIMRQDSAREAIQDCDLWVLTTDGQIPHDDVTDLTILAERHAISQVPVILVIHGGIYGSPEMANISVGISFFASASDALILFRHVSTGEFYVIDAKGAFTSLGNQTGQVSHHLSDWNSLRKFPNTASLTEAFRKEGISFDSDRSRRQFKGVSLGQEWDISTNNALVKVPELLKQTQLAAKDLRHLLQEEAITQLALTCKIRSSLGALRQLLIRHKQQEIVVRLEDRHGAGKIMEQMTMAEGLSEKTRLSQGLRQAHIANRQTYQELKDDPSVETKQIMEINRLIDRGLRIISTFEKSSYTADILNRKSNRAMRADVVSAADSELKLAALDLSDDVRAFRGSCNICCGEQEIMSVVLKKLDAVEENTTDFALNFPLAAAHAKQNLNLVSSQSICFQCALLLDRSIYQEEIAAKLPAVSFEGANKNYITHQLYLALTSGLATGTSALVQLFATLLDRTIETKSWCAEDGDSESLARREILEWMQNELLANCPCRENFGETGPWVKYPQALTWAANEFREAGLDSWIIQYPIAGFTQMMRWHKMLDLGVPEEQLVAIQHAKLIHLVTSQIMNNLLKADRDDKTWTYPFLQLIYRHFNAPGVPKDQGENESLVASDEFWARLGVALGAEQWVDTRQFLKLFDGNEAAYPIERVQLVTFWAVFTQNNHTMPKTLFSNLKSREALATAALDTASSMPAPSARKVLLSIFCQSNRTDTVYSMHQNEAAPFVSPYGPSVLQCGMPGCGEKFYTPEDLDKDRQNLHLIVRDNRAKHLSDVFAVAPGTFKSQTGLPEATSAPDPPSSTHITLHISIAKTWARLSLGERKEVMEAIDGYEQYNDVLHRFVEKACLQICRTSGRGNIYSARVDDDVRAVLLSFIMALRRASEKLGLEDQSGVAFEHDWTMNTVVGKMEYELGLDGQ